MATTVTLWPEDQDGICDQPSCEGEDPCVHVVCAVLAFERDQIRSLKETTYMSYEWPQLSRTFHTPEGELISLKTSLVSYLGGIQSGRESGPFPIVVKKDFEMDRLLSLSKIDEARALYLGEPQKELVLPAHTSESTSSLVSGLGETHSTNEAENFQIEWNWELWNEGASILTVSLTTSRLNSVSRVSDLFLTLERALDQALFREFGYKLSVPFQMDVVRSFEFQKQIQTIKKFSEEFIRQRTHQEMGEIFAPKGSAWNAFVIQEASVKVHLKISESAQLQVFFEVPAASDGSLQGGLRRFPISIHHELWSKRRLSSDSFGDPFPIVLGGQWFHAPDAWLAEYGDRAREILLLQSTKKNTSASSSIKRNHSLAYEVTLLNDLMGIENSEVASSIHQLRDRLIQKENYAPLVSGSSLSPEVLTLLRPYQKTGIQYLNWMRSMELGALLADDMGLGKTLQVLCVLQKLSFASNGQTSLIIVPTSLIYTWVDQIKQFRPDLKVSVYYGSQRKLDFQQDLILTTYGILRQDAGSLLGPSWNSVVLDEAHTIKNRQSQITQVVHQLKAVHRVMMTGTPIENSLDDLWSLFRFLQPELLGTFEHYKKLSPEKIKLLVQPFILKRKKSEVAKDLPSKIETTVKLDLSSEERELYRALEITSREEVLSQLSEDSLNLMHLLELLLRLRQSCCHPQLVETKSFKKTASSKIEFLMNQLEELLSQGQAALVFSQWTSFLDLIEIPLKEKGISFLRLDGSTQNRQEVIQEFQNPNGPRVLLLSLKAGGVGLTLTRAEHVFLMDPWWNPAVEEQAMDRAHRIGQTKTVQVTRIIAKDTIEEKILELQNKKRSTSQFILDETSQSFKVTKEDLLSLLSH
jgi:hypothetical protein